MRGFMATQYRIGPPASARDLGLTAQSLSKKCTVPAKPCDARAGHLGHTPGVDPLPRDRLVRLFPAIKADWIERLRGEPALTPLGRPDTLVYLMDATLRQWTAGLAAPDRAQWLRHLRPLAGAVHLHCACGLDPVLNYYATGATAIAGVAGGALGPEADAALAFFRQLARHETDALCAACRQPGPPDCPRPRLSPSP